jgi:hypothetical protein
VAALISEAEAGADGEGGEKHIVSPVGSGVEEDHPPRYLFVAGFGLP